ncbi:CRISPR-associated protein Cas4 [Haladaptatus sp.]|uniref:CRISPR-associated protein Cas4 n=1 Tax=Haladaptatus sp. TaxID=1973141 RepID=UPI003C3AB0EE
MSKVTFSDLEAATYCPRKLYYRRKDDIAVPDIVTERRELAYQYDRLVDAPTSELADLPLEVSLAQFRENLERATLLEDWEILADPSERDRPVEGKDCRGIVHKVLDGDPPVPSMIFTGTPPETGIWEPQSVRVVAAAKALSWEYERMIERAFVEYPAHGIVREIALSTRRKAAYRRVLRTARAIDGPPPRLTNTSKCDACEYRAECGVKTRTLRSLLGG